MATAAGVSGGRLKLLGTPVGPSVGPHASAGAVSLDGALAGGRQVLGHGSPDI